jgi:hypothetical protein
MTKLKTRKVSRGKTAAVDPIFAAIAEHKALAKVCTSVTNSSPPKKKRQKLFEGGRGR